MGQDWIGRLGLEPHPEGGWFRRIHAEPQRVESTNGPRVAATAIHYLLTRAAPVGHLHRNRSTILHFLQSGGPVEYVLLDIASGERRVVLGFEAGQSIQLVVPGGIWKASRLVNGAHHALVSEVVVPGWDAADHEFMDLETLGLNFPEHVAALSSLVCTRS
ncbi:MAG: cupin domain-containing protein [Panacagrimonas sp.]